MSSPAGPRLRVRDLNVFYGKICAVRSLSIDIGAGEVVALIGPNSAGKTSSVLAIATRSTHRRVSGDIALDGAPIAALRTASRQSMGIRLVPEGRQVFPTLTVEDNLRVIADQVGVEWADALVRSRALFPRVFVERFRSLAGNLSGGEQQMLALARALIGQPRVLLLDEPSLGLARGITLELAGVINEVRSLGIAVLLADQNVAPWKRIVDHIFVMLRGRVIARVEHADQVDRLIGVG